jgi:hypothetical protein
VETVKDIRREDLDDIRKMWKIALDCRRMGFEVRVGSFSEMKINKKFCLNFCMMHLVVTVQCHWS